MGEIFQKFGEEEREFPQNNIGGRKVWGKFSRNFEKICARFQKTLLAGGNYGGIFPEIWGRYARISKKTILVGRKLWGNVSRKLEKIYAKFQENNIGGRKLWGNFSRNLERFCANF